MKKLFTLLVFALLTTKIFANAPMDAADTSDAGISVILSPKNNVCGDSIINIVFKLHNIGTDTISNFRINAKIEGIDVFTDTFSESGFMIYPGSLKPGGDSILSISLIKNLGNYVATGTSVIKVWTTLKNDQDHSNDTAIAIDTFLGGIIARFSNFNSICLHSKVAFVDHSLSFDGAVTMNWLWDFGNGDTSSVANPIYMYTSPGKFTLKLKVTNTNGCMDSIIQKVNIDTIISSFSYKIDTGKNIVNFIAKDTAWPYYSWNFGDNSSFDTTFKTSHFFLTKGKYPVTLRASNGLGCASEWSDTIIISRTGIESSEDAFKFSLYPNPFQNFTNINYTLESGENVNVEVFDLTGRRIALLANEMQIAGEHNLKFIPGNYNANSGMYLIKMQIGDRMITKEIMMLK